MRDTIDAGEPAYRPMTPWGPWSGLGMSAAIILLSFLTATVAGAVTLQLAGIPWPKTAADIAPVMPYFLPSMVLTQIVWSVLTWVAASWHQGDPRLVLALRPAIGRPLHWAGAICAFLILAYGAAALIGLVSGSTGAEDQAQILPLIDNPLWPLAFIAVAIGAPVSEELLFRGFLFSALARSRVGIMGAAFITSLLWTLIHGYTPEGRLTIFVIGLMLSFLLVRSGSIWVPIAAHAAFNTVSFLLLMAAVQGGTPVTP